MPLARMSFLGHLEELRRRVLFSLAALLAASAACFFAADPLLSLLLAPAGGLQLRAFGIMDGFLIKLRLAFVAGLVVSSPAWGSQVLGFVLPALEPRERRGLAFLLGTGVVLFAAGLVFGYSLLSTMIRVLVAIFPARVEYLPSASDYLSFVLFFLLACGAAFQLPVVVVLLVRFGIVRVQTLRRRRKIGWFVLFVFAELITPVTDPIVAPLTVLVPLIVLYEAGLLVAARIATRPSAAR
jgi:sec-independent protein translocase protein TatC